MTLLFSTFFLVHALVQAAGGVWLDAWTEHISRPLSSLFCLYAEENGVTWDEDEPIQCFYAAVGETPTHKTAFQSAQKRCCFTHVLRDGVIWAIGETVMTHIEPIVSPFSDEKNRAFSGQRLEFHPVRLHDVLVLDKATGFPVPQARVIVSDAPLHLIAYAKTTDEDGYAVIPTLPSQPLVVSVRADGYLPHSSVSLLQEKDLEETIIELDPGVRLTGSVSNPNGVPIAQATLHLEITQPSGHVWYSDLDNPLSIASFASFDGASFIPQRAYYRTNAKGLFTIFPIPNGKIRIYATHPEYSPSVIQTADGQDGAKLAPLHLTLAAPHQAYVRTENEDGAAIKASVYFFDTVTNSEVARLSTKDKGMSSIENLPEKVRIYAFADGYIPLQKTLHLKGLDEIRLVLQKQNARVYKVQILDAHGSPIGNASVAPKMPEMRRQFSECQGKTSKEGIVTLQKCPKDFEIAIYHPEYALTHAHLSPQTPDWIQISLSQGTDGILYFMDQKSQESLTDVVCHAWIKGDSCQGTVPDDSEQFTTKTGMIRLPHRSAPVYCLRCTRDQMWTEIFEYRPTPEKQSLMFPSVADRTFIVLDSFGAPVPYAHVETPQKRYEADDLGVVRVPFRENDALTFRHYHHGMVRKTREDVHAYIHAPKDRPIEVRLPDTLDLASKQCAIQMGITVIEDGAEIRIDDAGKLRERGILRGDSIESCTSDRLILIREDRVVEIRLP